MAFVKIRGSQIQDEVLKDNHIAEDAAINESKLNIGWAAHYQQALETKKVVDYVQVNGKSATGTEFDLTADGTIAGTAARTTSDPLDAEGIIIGGTKNFAPIRDAVTGDPILSASTAEVFGRVEFVDADGIAESGDEKFVLKFLSMEDDGTGTLVETPFDMPASTIDFQFAQRFNLQTVNEMFAANEKFVEGAADATAHLNIEQLAKDIYGPTFSLDRDGNANLARNLVDEILVQTRGVLNDTVRANTIIDEVVSARGTFADIGARFSDIEGKVSQEIIDRQAGDQAIRDDLASNAAAKGASLVGIEDASAVFTATTVEGALSELETRMQGVEGGGSATGDEVNAARSSSITGDHVDLDTRIEAGEARAEAVKDEVEAARSSMAKSADGIAPKEFANVDARLEEIETDAQADTQVLEDYKTANDTRSTAIEAKDTEQDGRLTDLETEVVAARGSETSVDVRLDRALNEDGTLKAGKQIHDHKKFVFQAAGGETKVNLPTGDAFQADDTLDVYVNGLLQAKGIHYTEIMDSVDVTKGIGVDFAPEVLVAGDIVILKYVNNNAE